MTDLSSPEIQATFKNNRVAVILTNLAMAILALLSMIKLVKQTPPTEPIPSAALPFILPLVKAYSLFNQELNCL